MDDQLFIIFSIILVSFSFIFYKIGILEGKLNNNNNFINVVKTEEEPPTETKTTLDDIIGSEKKDNIDDLIRNFDESVDKKSTKSDKNKVLRDKLTSFNDDTDEIWKRKMAIKMKVGENGSEEPIDVRNLDLDNEYKKIEEMTLDEILS